MHVNQFLLIYHTFMAEKFYEYHNIFYQKCAMGLKQGIKVKWAEKDKDLLHMIIGGRHAITCNICKEVSHTTLYCPQIGSRVNVRKFHESECSEMPAEMFAENNGYWRSVKPESYLCLSSRHPKKVQLPSTCVCWSSSGLRDWGRKHQRPKKIF